LSAKLVPTFAARGRRGDSATDSHGLILGFLDRLSTPTDFIKRTLCPQKLAITSPTSGGRSVGIVRSRTQTMEFRLVLVYENVSEHWLMF
jgi:hypothetical protein